MPTKPKTVTANAWAVLDKKGKFQFSESSMRIAKASAYPDYMVVKCTITYQVKK